ncbi:MAG: TolB family protein [Gaiellaceae bacterium]
MIRLLRLAALGVAVILGVAAGPASPAGGATCQPPPDECQSPIRTDYYTVGIDGGQTKIRQRLPRDARVLAVSPDAERIVYSIRVGSIFLASISGQLERRIALDPRAGAREANWSRDGRKIALIIDTGFSSRCGFLELWVVDADGSDLRRLTDCASTPSWSPNSRQLAFWTPKGGRQLLAVIEDAPGAEARMLTPRSDGGLQPAAWSPDGRLIAYLEGLNLRVRVIQPDGRNDRVVALGTSVTWSPDGRRLVLNRYGRTRSRPEPHWALAIVELDGRVVGEIDRGDKHWPWAGTFIRVSWSAQGGIAYSRDPGRGSTQVFLVWPNGTHRRQLTRDPGSEGVVGLMWISGQRRIFYTRPRCE